mgnify:CR=1 FL=1
MKFIRQNWLISRRQVLRGFGVSLALPLLDCMRPLRAVAAQQGFKPRRSAFIYLPNGVNTLDYQIAKVRNGLYVHGIASSVRETSHEYYTN